jgi:hypothetical protein
MRVRRYLMGWFVVLLLILAAVLGGVGLFVVALRWLLIVALVLLIISVFSGWTARRRV